ncbi:hypothetical protein AZH11_08525 [Pseudomonas simiae]|nr:hypothetical protein AZH11_08525 [Pseudomonas simiae]
MLAGEGWGIPRFIDQKVGTQLFFESRYIILPTIPSIVDLKSNLPQARENKVSTVIGAFHSIAFFAKPRQIL